MSYVLIKNGYIYDGLGNPPFVGSLLLEDENIKEIFIGKEVYKLKNLENTSIIDAEGYIITPGFIDIHRHCDIQPFYGTEFGTTLLSQGITTVVAGNCGFSMVPIPLDEELSKEIYDFSEPVLGKPFREIKTISDYFSKLGNINLPVNFATMIGCGTIKSSIKGFSNTPFNSEEIKKAVSYIEQAVEMGVVGVSAGIMYIPECYNFKEDYIRMLQPLKKHNIPWCVHIRGEGNSLVSSITEVIDIAEKVRCPVEISHFKSCGKNNWNREIFKAIDCIELARKNGIEVACDFYPYTGGSTSLVTMIPPQLIKGDIKKILNSFETGEGIQNFRDSLKYTYVDWDNYALSLGWDRILITGVNHEKNIKYIGKTVADSVINYNFSDAAEFVGYLLNDEEGKVSIVNMSMCQEDVDVVAKLPYSCVISDAIYAETNMPHPRMYGAFPKIIREYVNERKIYSLETAVKKMTSMPAKRIGITGRGAIKVGYYADINIFKLDEFKDNATYENPKQLATGLDKCFVNGKIAWSKNKVVNDSCGKKICKN